MKKFHLGLSHFILVFLLASPSFASSFETRTLVDKTFVHDNTYCDINGKRLEVEVRSFDQYTTHGEAEYGEQVFIIQNGKYILLPLGMNRIGRYKLLKGHDSNCTKSLSLKASATEIVLFFLKDNRPLLDTLTVVIYSSSTKTAKVNETKFGIIQAGVDNGTLRFSTSNSAHALEVGKTTIRNKDYVFSRRKLNVWFKFNKEGFELDPERTFGQFEHKKFFSSKEEFFKAFALNSPKTKFKKDTYTYAVHHPTKEECFSLDAGKWVCSNSLNKGPKQMTPEKFDLALLRD